MSNLCFFTFDIIQFSVGQLLSTLYRVAILVVTIVFLHDIQDIHGHMRLYNVVYILTIIMLVGQLILLFIIFAIMSKSTPISNFFKSRCELFKKDRKS